MIAGEVKELWIQCCCADLGYFRGISIKALIPRLIFFFQMKPYNFLVLYEKCPQHHKSTFCTPIGLPLTLIRGCLSKKLWGVKSDLPCISSEITNVADSDIPQDLACSPQPILSLFFATSYKKLKHQPYLSGLTFF